MSRIWTLCWYHYNGRSVDSLDACIYAEIRTRIPDTISWDYNFEPAGTTPLTFTVKVFWCIYGTKSGVFSCLIQNESAADFPLWIIYCFLNITSAAGFHWIYVVICWNFSFIWCIKILFTFIFSKQIYVNT